VAEGSARFLGTIETRYQGQNYEISIPVDPLHLPAMEDFAAAFGEAHLKEYGYRGAGSAVEAVNCRITAIGTVPKAEISRQTVSGSLEAAVTSRRPVYFGEAGWVATPVYDRAAIPSEVDFSGPAISDEMSSTTVVLPGQQVRK